MANKYKISSKSLYSFINEGIYKLPRFQRKDTWRDQQYFELCLSIFQDYPIGSVIVNNDNKSLWLLDGRQRRTCVKTLFENPLAVYGWARKTCKFKPADQFDAVRDRYDEKVRDFLGRDLDDPSDDNEQDEGQVSQEEEASTTSDPPRQQPEDDLARVEQSASLNVFYEYILLVHNKLYKAFDLRDYFTEKNLQYYSKDQNNESYVDPVKLSGFIREINRRPDRYTIIASADNLQKHLEDRFDIIQKPGKDQSKALNKHISKFWDVIFSKVFNIYSDLDTILTNSEVGFIELNNARIVDAQNVFSKINSGGTQLNAAELLSAKPYWNQCAKPSEEQKAIIDCLYAKLKTDDLEPNEKSYCRWDVVATLLPTVDPHRIFFNSQNNIQSIQNVNVVEIAMGFKLLSSCFATPKGMSKLCLESLEGNDSKLKWTDDLRSYIISMSKMIDVLQNLTNLAILPSWHCSLYDLFGAAATMELLAGAWIMWEERGVKDMNHSSSDFIQFLNGFKNHLDRVIREKVAGSYKGSGDSKMASNLKDIDRRVAKVTDEDNEKWESLIRECCEGTLNGKPFKHEAMRAILFYEKIIRRISSSSNDCFEIDHIYPQYMFRTGNGLLSQNDENSLANLALLPSQENKQKLNSTLDNPNFSPGLKVAISTYEGIAETDFSKYSKAENFNELKEERKTKLLQTFTSTRQAYLNT